MKKVLSLFLILFVNLNVFSQLPDWAWVKGSGGGSGDSGNSICKNSNGDIYVAGSFSSASISFDSFTLTNSNSSSFSTDIFVTKYNSTGNVIWAVSFGGSGSEEIKGICTDTAGNVYVTGYFNSVNLSFGSTTLVNNDAAGFSKDIFIAKLNSSSSLVWAKNAGGNNNDYANAIASDNKGNIFITGGFQSSSIVFDTINMNAISNNGSDVYVVKYDGSGNGIWARVAGGELLNNSYAVSTDTAGNIAIAGSFQADTLFFPAIYLTKNDTTGSDTTGYSSDIFIAKYNKSGNLLWVKSAGGKNRGASEDLSSALVNDNYGNTYIGGYFRNDTLSIGNFSLPNNNHFEQRDCFYAKYDSLGNVIWANRAGGLFDDEVRAITIDASNNLYVLGSFLSSSINFGTNTLVNSNAGYQDIFIAKMDTLGTIIWLKDAGGSSSEFVNAVCVGSITDELYLVGSYYGATSQFGIFSISNADVTGFSTDIFVARLIPMTVGIANEVSTIDQILVYPNPASSFANLVYKLEKSTFIKIEILNELGQVIAMPVNKESQNQGVFNLRIDNLRSGIYFVKMTTNTIVYSKKIIFSN